MDEKLMTLMTFDNYGMVKVGGVFDSGNAKPQSISLNNTPGDLSVFNTIELIPGTNYPENASPYVIKMVLNNDNALCLYANGFESGVWWDDEPW